MLVFFLYDEKYVKFEKYWAVLAKYFSHVPDDLAEFNQHQIPTSFIECNSTWKCGKQVTLLPLILLPDLAFSQTAKKIWSLLQPV